MKKLSFLMILTAVMLLSACSKKPAEVEETTVTAAVTEAPATSEAATEAAEETSAKAAETAATAAESTAASEETSAKAAETAAETSECATEASAAAEEKEPINAHFGYFVKYGDKVYYRRPGADAMKETALFGNFLAESLGTSEICSYDTKTGEIREENSSLGCGPMAVCGGDLYVSEYDYPNDIEVECVCSIGLDEYDYVFECGDRLSGASENGKWVISREAVYGKDGNLFCLYYTDGNGIESIESSDPLTYIGAASDYLIYEVVRDDRYLLWRCNMETGELLQLGEIPVFEELSLYYPGEPEGFAYENGKIAVIFSAYDGTGHFYSGSNLVTADVNKKNSLLCEEVSYQSEYFHDEMSRGPGVVFIGGKPVFTDGMPYDAEIDYRTGNMILFDEEGKATVIGSGYDFYESGEEGTTVDIEAAEYVDGMIYAVRNEMWHVPEEDVGWRYAYERKFTYILQIDPETGEETIIDAVENAV